MIETILVIYFLVALVFAFACVASGKYRMYQAMALGLFFWISMPVMVYRMLYDSNLS
jgi:hypothetical protein